MTANKGKKRARWAKVVLKEKARKQGWKEGVEVFKCMAERVREKGV